MTCYTLIYFTISALALIGSVEQSDAPSNAWTTFIAVSHPNLGVVLDSAQVRVREVISIYIYSAEAKDSILVEIYNDVDNDRQLTASDERVFALFVINGDVNDGFADEPKLIHHNMSTVIENIIMLSKPNATEESVSYYFLSVEDKKEYAPLSIIITPKSLLDNLASVHPHLGFPHGRRPFLRTSRPDADGIASIIQAQVSEDQLHDQCLITLITLRSLQHADSMCQYEIRSMLQRMSSTYLFALLNYGEAFSAYREAIQIAAIHVVGIRAIDEAKAIAALTRVLLISGKGKTRIVAAMALGRLKNTQAITTLKKAAYNDNADIRLAAINGFYLTRDSTHTPFLGDLLKQEQKERVRIAIIRTLGELGGNQAIPPLVNAFDHSTAATRQELFETLIKINMWR